VIGALFLCFLGVLVLAPLPFGGAPQLAGTVLAAAVGILALLYALALPFVPPDPTRAAPAVAARRTWWLAAGFALLVAWAAAQMLPVWPAALAYPGWAATADSRAGGLPLTPDTAAAGDVLMRLVSYAAVFWLTVQFCRDGRRARTLLWALVAAGALYAAYGIVMRFGGFDLVLWWEKRVYSESVTGPFVNRNHFATYAGMLAAASLVLLLRRLAAIGGGGLAPLPRLGFVLDSLGRTGWAALTATLVLLAAVALSTSRAGTLATAAGLAVAFLALALRPGERPGSWLTALAVALLVGGLTALGTGLLEGLVGRLAPEAAGVLGTRDAVVRLTLEALAERPLTGSGLGSFPSLFEAGRTLELARSGGRPYLHAHNSYVELAAEAGLPAFLLMQALLLGIAWRCWHGLRHRRRNWIFCAAGLAAGTVAAVHAAFDFSVQIPAVGMTLAALLGLGYAQSWRSSTASPRSPTGQARQTGS
jgi:O-antigen ligase